MKFLNHLDLVENEARRLKMYRVAAASYTPSINTSGNIILDTAAGIPKWWDQTGNSGSGIWRDFAYGTASISNWTIQSDSGSNIQVDTGDTLDLTGGAALVTTTSGTAAAPVVTFDVQTYGVMSSTTTAARAGDAGTKIYAVERHPTTDKLQVHVPWQDHKATTFTLTADSGTNQIIADTDTMDIAGGTGTSTVVGGTDTVTVNANTFAANNSANAAEETGDTGTKWYGVQTDSNNKLVVRVPWTDSAVRTVAVDTTGNGVANNTLLASETLLLSEGSNVSLAENAGVVTIGATNTTYSEMDDSTFGLGKHAFNTVGTIDNTVYGGLDGFASDRTYGIIGDANGKLCVHVPWTTTTNTDARYALSVGAVSSNESTLSLLGTAGGSTTTAKFSGTTNEIEITTPATGNGGDITIGLPDDVTIGNDLTVTNDCTITGDLTVNGTTTTIDTTQLVIEDNLITLNKNQTGTPSSTLTSGIEVERGNPTNSSLHWVEQTDKWVANDGSNSYNIIQNLFSSVTSDSGTATANSYTTALDVTGSNGISTSASGQAVVISGANVMAQFSKVATITAAGAGGLNASTNKLATITHNLGTKDVVVRLYEIGTGENTNYTEIYADVTATSTSVVTVQFSANLTANVRVVIMAAKSASAVTPTYS
tara:strand:- start:3874 stop:5832 length:1959 start_codon:yes stop_codon:yes gene_type:complete